MGYRSVCDQAEQRFRAAFPGLPWLPELAGDREEVDDDDNAVDALRAAVSSAAGFGTAA